MVRTAGFALEDQPWSCRRPHGARTGRLGATWPPVRLQQHPVHVCRCLPHAARLPLALRSLGTSALGGFRYDMAVRGPMEDRTVQLSRRGILVS